MACFLVPAAEAIVVTAVYAVTKKKEQKEELPKFSKEKNLSNDKPVIPRSKKISWLMSMLWGGVLLLAFEHFYHGEIQPFPPFLTAMMSPGDTAEMLHEMATVGVAMAVIVTLAWAVMCLISSVKTKKTADSITAE